MSDLPQMPLTTGTMASRLALDTSGESLNNLIVEEPHTLLSYRYRALVPKNGALFTKSAKLVDALTGRELVVGIDYRFAVQYQSLALLYGQDVAAAIIVINPDVSMNVLLTYQAVGDDYVYNIPALQQLLSTDNETEVSKSFLDLQNRDLQVMASPHYHPLGDGMGFEYLVFAIESLMRVLTLGDNKILASMFERIDIKLQDIAQQAIGRQDGELMVLMTRFVKGFTKERLGLGNVPNYPEATEQDGRNASNPKFNLGSDINNRMTTLKTLVAFREELMQYLVSRETTGLGGIYGTYLLPTLAGIESMTNGSRFIVDSMDAAAIAGIPYDPQIYPDRTVPSNRWSLTKITNNINNRGGLLQAVNMQTGQMYIGVMSYPTTTAQIVWRRQSTEADMASTLDMLTKHIMNTNNPHKLKAADVDLDQVENLRVADRVTIMARKPLREYMTYDGLLLFMSAFMSGDWTIDDSEGTTPEQKAKARKAYTTLFASAGICDKDPGLVLQNAPRVPESTVPPRGQPAGWYCEGTTKVMKITDGFGGYFIENTLSSSDCGFIAEVANYEIRDQNQGLIGLGFKVGGRVDAAATVALQNADGQTVCFIYNTPASGRTVVVQNSAGTVLGYAIDPR